MASSYKSIETQVLGLSALEFYKNKNNWKLYEDLRKKPQPSFKIKKLNKDFLELLEYDVELLSPHNNIFLDEKPPAAHLELKPAEDPLDLQLDYLTPAQIRQVAEDWLTLHGFPVSQKGHGDTYDVYGLLESAALERGAHSNVDQSVARATRPCTCNTSVCMLSVQQLARAIQLHQSALTLLLREQAVRDRLSSRSLLHPPIPFEDYPTRDTDPLRTPDSVLLSSHLMLSAFRHARPWMSASAQCHRHRNVKNLPDIRTNNFEM